MNSPALRKPKKPRQNAAHSMNLSGPGREAVDRFLLTTTEKHYINPVVEPARGAPRFWLSFRIGISAGVG